MADKEETGQPEERKTEAPVQEETEALVVETSDTAQEEAPHVSGEARTGRLIMSGLVAATIVSAVVVLVAAIFQLASIWGSCPRSLSPNGSAEALWKETIADKVTPQTLGVSGQLLQETKFKTPEGASPESGQGKEENR